MPSRTKRSALVPSYCEFPGCNFKHGIQKHRIHPGREGGKYVLGNVIALCPNHHWLADRGIITQDELYRLVVERIARDAARNQSGIGSDTAERLGFADTPVSSGPICWADVQDGNVFFYEGRCSVSAVESDDRSNPAE